MYKNDRLMYIINIRKDSIMKRAAMDRREKDLLSNLTRPINYLRVYSCKLDCHGKSLWK